MLFLTARFPYIPRICTATNFNICVLIYRLFSTTEIVMWCYLLGTYSYRLEKLEEVEKYEISIKWIK